MRGAIPPYVTYAQNLWLYFALLFGIIIVPGMDMFFVIANALAGGRLRGLMATAGIMAGGVAHTAFGAFGVSAVLKAVPKALDVVLVAGAFYMLWIAYSLLKSSIRVESIGNTDVRTNLAAFRQGLITCLLNPKAYLFVVAVYPQFIRPEYGPVLAQALVMGTMTFCMQGTVYGGLGLAAARGRDALLSKPVLTIWIARATGALFLFAALATMYNGLMH